MCVKVILSLEIGLGQTHPQTNPSRVTGVTATLQRRYRRYGDIADVTATLQRRSRCRRGVTATLQT